MKAPSAEEFLDMRFESCFDVTEFPNVTMSLEDTANAMKAFAELHVKLALRQAARKAELMYHNFGFESVPLIDKKSILGAYDMKNILAEKQQTNE